MKRSVLFLLAAAVTVTLAPTGRAFANPPTRVPTLNQPVDFSAGDVCPFAVHVQPITDREVSTSHYDAEGNLRWIGVTGFLDVQVTNTDTGNSMLVNISGPGKFTFRSDGTVVLNAVGNWLLFQRATDSPPSEMLLNSGHILTTFSPTGVATILHRTGSGQNLCGALA